MLIVTHRFFLLAIKFHFTHITQMCLCESCEVLIEVAQSVVKDNSPVMWHCVVCTHRAQNKEQKSMCSMQMKMFNQQGFKVHVTYMLMSFWICDCAFSSPDVNVYRIVQYIEAPEWHLKLLSTILPYFFKSRSCWHFSWVFVINNRTSPKNNNLWEPCDINCVWTLHARSKNIYVH